MDSDCGSCPATYQGPPTDFSHVASNGAPRRASIQKKENKIYRPACNENILGQWQIVTAQSSFNIAECMLED